jgi:glucose/arabinose dehydrogenase
MKMNNDRWASHWMALCFLVFALVLSACGGSNTVNNPTNSNEAVPTITVESQADPVEPTVVQEVPAAAPTETQPSAPVADTGSQVEAAATQAPTTSAVAVPTDSVTEFPDPSGFSWEPVVSGLVKPLDLTSPPDGSGRLFILEQPGIIRVFQDGSLLAEPFLDIQQKALSSGSEQGLLGLAFHPDYAQNGFFFINYTSRDGDGDNTVARYQVSSADPNRADPDSEQILLQIDDPYGNHNGGGTVFGPDGYLYIGFGDGGSANDPLGNGQSTDTLLGKLLRIDVNGSQPYAIPADNPFANGGGKPEIWAYGLRNPWRFSFDRLTGDLYIADVGQNQWEEVDFQPSGAPGGQNYGWDYREGSHPFEGQPPSGLELVDPIFEYQHGYGCSVTGGYVYRGEALPEFRGIYLLSDFCSGRVWGLLRAADGTWQSQELFQTGLSVTSFGQDQQGEIYLMDQPSGSVYRLQRR